MTWITQVRYLYTRCYVIAVMLSLSLSLLAASAYFTVSIRLSLSVPVLFCFVCTWCAIRSGATNWLKGRLTVYQGAIQKRERSIASLPVSNIPIRECAHQAVGSRLWRFRFVIENSKEPAKVRFGVTSLNLLHSNPISVHFWFYFWNSLFCFTRARRADVCAHCDASPQKNPMPARHIFASFLFNFLSDVTPFPSLL
jgi:hypothetical protein